MSKTLRDLATAIQKGVITPDLFQVGGSLPAEQAAAFFKLIESQSPFLGKVTSEPMGKLNKNVKVLDVAGRILVRVAEGALPSDGQKAEPAFGPVTLTALPNQAYFDIGFSTLADRASEPDFEATLEAEFARAVGRDILDLGFNGTIDDNSSGFLTLNKGWVQLALDHADTHKGTWNLAAPGTWVARLQALVELLPDRYKEGAEITMNRTDYEAYVAEVGSMDGGLSILLSGKVEGYMGYKINAETLFPADHLLFTQPRNLIHGRVTTDVERHRQANARARAVEWTINFWNDYQIGIPAALAITRGITV